MRRAFLVSNENEFSEWIKEELKEYARVVRVTEQSNFFIQQWETTDAELAIVLFSAIDSFESFSKAYNQIVLKTPNIPFVFIYSVQDSEEEDLINFKQEEQIWIEWNDLDFGLIEKRLEAFYSIKELHSSVHSMPKQSKADTGANIELVVSADNDFITEEETANELYTEELPPEVNILENEVSIQNDITDFPLVDSSEAVECVEQSEGIEEIEKVEQQITVDDQTTRNSIETDEFLAPRNNKTKRIMNRPKLPSLPKHGEVTERIVFTERIIGTVIIALTGTNSGSGTTYNTIQIASYLNSCGFNVACVEMVDPDVNTASFKFLDEGNQKQTKIEKGFHLNGIDFYKEVDQEKYIQIIHAQYQYVVVDLGGILTSTLVKPVEGKYFKEFLRAHLSILCTRPAVWDFPYLISYIDKLLTNSWSKQINLSINLADDERFDYFCSRFEPKVKKALQLRFYQNEFNSDPFKNYELSVLKTLLAEVLPKTHKENRFLSLFRSKKNSGGF